MLENNEVERLTKLSEKHMNIDGTKLVAKDIAKILNEFPMCDIEIINKSLIILNHTGIIVKQINF